MRRVIASLQSQLEVPVFTARTGLIAMPAPNAMYATAISRSAFAEDPCFHDHLEPRHLAWVS